MNNDPIRPEEQTEDEKTSASEPACNLISQADGESEQIEAPSESGEALATENENKKGGFIRGAFDILEMFAWSVFVVMILFTFVIRLCRVEGHSMENTLHENENLILYSLFYTPEQNDIIVFHLTDPEIGLEKTMVKRVIATEGQTIEINFETGVMLIDGEPYDDRYGVFKDRFSDVEIGHYTLYAEHNYDSTSRTFSATVPEGHVFVMGDNRNNSKDSRSVDVGFVDTRCILGKAILRIAPFTSFIDQ